MSKPMSMHGGPKGMPGGPGMQPRKLDKKTLKRLLSYLKNYKGTIVLVTICILLSAVAGAASSMFLQGRSRYRFKPCSQTSATKLSRVCGVVGHSGPRPSDRRGFVASLRVMR